jgi:hypothetical protein
VAVASGESSFYSTAAQVIPVLFLGATIQGPILWRFARPLLARLDDKSREAIESAASLAALVLVLIVSGGEAQALYKLTNKTFIVSGDWPIYLAIWAAGLGIVLPFVLTQVRAAARAGNGRRQRVLHLSVAAIFLAAYVVAALLDVATRV